MNYKMLVWLLLSCVARCKDRQEPDLIQLSENSAQSETIQDNSAKSDSTSHKLKLLTTEEQDKLVEETIQKFNALDERLLTQMKYKQPIDTTLKEIESLLEVFVELNSIRRDQQENIEATEQCIVSGKFLLAKKESDDWTKELISALQNNKLEQMEKLIQIYDEKWEGWLECFASYIENFPDVDLVNLKQSIENLKENRRNLDENFLLARKEVIKWIQQAAAAFQNNKLEQMKKFIQIYDEKSEQWIEAFESVDTQVGKQSIENLKEQRRNLDENFLVARKEVEQWAKEVNAAFEVNSFVVMKKLRQIYDEKSEQWIEAFESVDTQAGRQSIENLKGSIDKIVIPYFSPEFMIFSIVVVYLIFIATVLTSISPDQAPINTGSGLLNSQHTVPQPAPQHITAPQHIPQLVAHQDATGDTGGT